MPTIKKIVRMNLTELIDWIWKNKIKDKKFVSEYVNSIVFVSKSGKISTGYSIGKTDTFKVEVEEPITEDTEIKGLVELGNDGHGTDFFQCNSSSINEQKDFDSEAFYILNDDLTMTLIWTKEKGMVE
ncbi:hypothetical protein V5G65_09500 [Mammaliicoccus sciuri]|uniref:hypothetical protein n=1 Tax=Mammaliicoccus sciuri TaxID=1296 RepID=UPI0037BCB968